ncbi:MAG: PhnD/SsuA/transferrin family substrate-binding protein [Candidatus Krumholzibacteriota bacterium]|nr:PhnD/SsuA/transferrin family substrate-binding protein [Candidatus Krumholzibacteriota bacterium]
MNKKLPRIDCDISSAYLGRWATGLVAAAVIVLALGAYFLEPDYMGHVPVRIGVCAFDSTVSTVALEALADLVREKGGGDITWVYFPAGQAPRDCDFYLMTSLQVYSHLPEGRLSCSLVAHSSPGHPYSPGVVIIKPETDRSLLNSGKIIFTHPGSAAGYLSPLLALQRSGYAIDPGGERIEFTGSRNGEEKVVFGVLFDAYRAGGLGLNKYRNILDRGQIKKGQLEILCVGDVYPEILIAADNSLESWKLKGFTDRLPSITENLPLALRTGLEELGITGFSAITDKELEFFRELPPWITDRLN